MAGSRRWGWVSLWLSFVVMAALLSPMQPQAAEALTEASLPGGTTLSVDIAEPLDGAIAGSDVPLRGTASIGGDSAGGITLISVMDLSGSTVVPGTGCGGDQNNDGRIDTIMDCEVAAVKALNLAAIDAGSVAETGVVIFEKLGLAADVGPASGVQVLTTPDADENGNGVLDIDEVVESVYYRGVWVLHQVWTSVFSTRSVGGVWGGTNFSGGVSAACDTVAAGSQPTNVVVFLSDGGGNIGDPVANHLPCATPTTFITFAIGPGSSCDADSVGIGSLQDIADLTGGECFEVPDVSELPDILPIVIRTQITDVTLSIDGGPPQSIASSVSPALPFAGPGEVEFDHLVEGLSPASHELCVTVHGEDLGGPGSVTECVTVINNRPPVADAGPDLTVLEGSVVGLDATASSDPDDDALSFQWSPISTDGPAVYLSSLTSPTPSFMAPDDGSYTFEVTVTDEGGLSDTDRVTVTVANADPVLTVEPTTGFAGGVTLMNGSFTDLGWVDVHSASIDWGDGTVDAIDVTAQGTGWGTFFGSHVYADAGSYDLTVTVTDDDGGSDSTTLSGFGVTDPVAVFANSETAKKSLNWGGASGLIEGWVHTNNELRFVGATKTVVGPSTYVGSLSVNLNKHDLDPPPVQTAAEPYPLYFDIADFRPGGAVATQVGDAYHDMTSSCHAGKWHETQIVLDPGVYYADCDIQINGSNIGGRVTLVAEGSIEVSGSRPAFEPFYDGLLFLAGESGKKAIDLSASSSKFLGVLFAEHGEIDVSGSDNNFYCGILGDTVDLSGGNLTMRGANCGRPDSTVAGPLLIPDLGFEFTADDTAAIPGDEVGYSLTVTNDGALLVVPGLLGLENVDASTASVTDFEFVLESYTGGVWQPLDATVDLSLDANDFTGVSYPADDAVVGTTVDPDGLASWGFQALVSLSPDQVTDLLDPAVTGGVRVRVEFTTDPADVQVRRLFTYGTDFIDTLRTLSADIGDVSATVLFPDGESLAFDAVSDPGLASVGAGASVPLATSFVVPVPAATGDNETAAAYVARLEALDDTDLFAAAFVTGAGGVGFLAAPQQITSVDRQLPVVDPVMFSPATATAGELVDITVDLANRGSATASDISVDGSAGGAGLLFSLSDATLLPGALGDAETSYAIADDALAHQLDTETSVAWFDANGNLYGPVTQQLTTVVSAAPELKATLADGLVDADDNGLPTVGDTLHYTLTIDNPRSSAIADVALEVAVDENLDVVAGSVTTSQGTITSGVSPITVEVGTVAASSSVTVEFDTLVPLSLPDDVVFVETQGTVTATGIDPILTDDPGGPGIADPTRTQIVALTESMAAILTDSLVVDVNGDGLPGAGDTLRYEAAVVSQGTAELTGVTFDLEPDANTALVVGSVTSSQGTITTGNTAGDGAVSIDIGDIGALGAVTIVFDAVIADPIPAGVEAVSVQGTVASNELGFLLTDDPSSGDPADATVTVLGGIVVPSLPGPVVSEITPEDGSVITEPVDIAGSLTPPEGEGLVGWSIGYRAVGSMVVTELASGTGAEVSASLDPTLLPNGIYMIVIEAESTNGGMSVTESSVVVDGRLKLGRFTTTFQDMAVGVGGFPVQVLRSYDSFDKTVGDFGVGWQLEIADFRVATNGPLGSQGWVKEGCGGGLIFAYECYHAERPHFVTVTWPDGLTEVFDMTPAQGSTFFASLSSAEFTGRDDTTSTLEAVDGSVLWSNGDFLAGAFGSGGVFDPQQFRLMDRFGTEYLLDVDKGLVELRDRNGNTLTITPDGIVSSFGPGIDITRDSLGRVELITGPDGSTVGYEYDSNGDLSFVTDQLGNRTEHTYLPGHYLDDIIDPLGRPIRTLEYDADDRITAVIDGEGNRTVIDSDVGARQEVVTDAEGRLTTISTFDERGNLVELDEVFDSAGHVTVFGYDANDNLSYRMDPDGNEWSAVYDGRDLVGFEDPVTDDISITYDEFGFPLLWTDQEGHATEYVWNPDGTLDQIIDPYGHAEAYTYYPDGNRETRTDRENNTWTWTYYPDGLVETEEDPEGNVTRFFYDDAGRIERTVDAGGGETLRAYDDAGNLRFLTNPELNVSEWRYDTLNRLEQRIDPAGDETQWTYYDNGLVETVTNGAGETTTYTYDRNGNTEAMSVASLDPTTYVYDGAGRLDTVTDPEGRATSYSYYDNGWLHTETNPFGGNTERFYYPDGQLQRVEDPFDQATSYTYTPAGRLDTVTDPMTRVTDYGYDLVGRQTTVVFDDGTFAENVYDKAGRLVSSFDQNRAETVFGYDGAGNRTSVTDPEDRTVAYGFDEFNRLETITNALGETTTYRYDGAGRLLETESASGVIVAYDYYPDGMRSSETDMFGNSSGWTYDGAGRVDVETDARGATTDYDYDPAGRLASITDHAGSSVLFGYNDAGEQISLTDPRGKTWLFDPGPVTRSESDPLGSTQTWTHDIAGRLASYTDGRGVTQSYGFYPDGQIDTVTHPDGQVVYTYDDLGRRETMSDESGVTTWAYDDTGRVTSVSAPAGDVSYTYRSDGRRESMTQPEGTVGYGYDSVGRLDTITDWSSEVASFDWRADGQLEAIARPNGVTTTYGYDITGRLDRIDHADSAGVVESFDYTLDANGNRTSVSSTAGVESYTINLINQLTGVTYPDGTTEAFTYDPAGNRQSATSGGVTTVYAYDDASRLVSDGTNTYSYDGAGNLTSDGVSTLGWDWDSRLETMTTGPDVTSYVYDADGVRVASDAGTGPVSYVFDRQAGLPTLISNGTDAYLHGPDGVLAEHNATGTSWLLTDALGSIRTAVDATGTVTDTAAYEVFGDIRTTSGDVGPFGYTGAQHDPGGLVYLNARYLSPDIGGFLSVDPVRPGAPGVAGYNPYSYTANNPTTWTDPSGATSTLERALIKTGTGGSIPPLAKLGAAVAAVFVGLKVLQECIEGDLPGPCRLPERNPGSGGTPTPPDWLRDYAGQLGVHWSDLDYCWANYLTDPAACAGIPDELMPDGWWSGDGWDVWQDDVLFRGQIIEEVLAMTEYADWYHIGAEDGGYFPLIDFQKGNTVVSLKTVDPSSPTAIQRMRNHIDDLGTRGVTISGVAADLVLDIRVPPGMESELAELRDYGSEYDVDVQIQGYP